MSNNEQKRTIMGKNEKVIYCISATLVRFNRSKEQKTNVTNTRT